MVSPQFSMIELIGAEAASTESNYQFTAGLRRAAEVFDELPSAMRTARRWLVWKEVPTPGKKPRKVPYYADGAPRGSGSELDSPEDVQRLVSFDEAIQALSSGRFSGLGFALGPDGLGSHWQGIDLDDLPDRPELEHLAKDLPGYTEKSPSGRGVHAIGYGPPFAAIGSNGKGIEAYSSGRFFTVTCDSAGIGEPVDLSDFVEQRLRPIHRLSGVAHLDVVHEVVDERVRHELRSALMFMRSDDRELWIRMGHALKPLGDVGRGLWLEWSSTSDKFEQSDAAKTWDSFNPSKTDHRAVFAEAQRRGWPNPMSSQAAAVAAESAIDATPLLSGAISATSMFGHSPDLNNALVDLTVSVSPDDKHPHVIDKIIPAGEVTLLSGHGGGGKSFVSLLMLVHVALGRAFCGLATSRVPVMFFSAEDDAAEIRRRLARICKVMDINQHELVDCLHVVDASEMDPTLFTIDQKGKGAETPGLCALSSLIQELDVGLVVIDNASDVFDGDEVNRRQVRAFIRELRQRLARPDRAVLLLSHVSKASVVNRRAGVDTSEDYSGSTAWHNSARSRLSLTPQNGGRIRIEHLKANKGSRAEPLNLEWLDGVPLPQGEHPGTGMAEALQRDFERKQDEDFKEVIVSIIHDFDRRGERVPTAMKGARTAHTALSASVNPVYPKSLELGRFNRLVRELEHEGRVFRTQVYTPNRKWVDCFTCSRVIVESAPNSSAQPVQAAVATLAQPLSAFNEAPHSARAQSPHP